MCPTLYHLIIRMSNTTSQKRAVREEISKLEGPTTITQALELLKKATSGTFDEAVELHVNLGIDLTRSEHIVRGTALLPHGTGKSPKIAVFAPESLHQELKDAGAHVVGAEELVNEIASSEKTDFEIAVATPDMMRHIGRIGKILGMRGLMPNPKNETVTQDPVKAVKELTGGKVTFRNDDGGNIHQVVGRLSYDVAQIEENVQVFMKEVLSRKPEGLKNPFIQKAVLTSSMGPGVPVRVQ